MAIPILSLPSERIPAQILSAAKITLGPNDRILYLGSPAPLNIALPAAGSYTLIIRRAIALTLITPDGQKTLQTSAQSVGQALAEAGYTLYAADRIDPPAETPIEAPLTVTYHPSQALLVTVDGTQVQVRSAAPSVGQALAEAGIPLIGLDFSTPPETAPLPADGKIRVTRVVESVALIQKSLPFATRTEPSADLELDQHGARAGLANPAWPLRVSVPPARMACRFRKKRRARALSARRRIASWVMAPRSSSALPWWMA